jgi:hypothetical protein
LTEVPHFHYLHKAHRNALAEEEKVKEDLFFERFLGSDCWIRTVAFVQERKDNTMSSPLARLGIRENGAVRAAALANLVQSLAIWIYGLGNTYGTRGLLLHDGLKIGD